MRDEAIALLNAIKSYNLAHEGDSDDAEIDAAFEMEDAAFQLLRKCAEVDPEISILLAQFEGSNMATPSLTKKSQ